MFVFLKSKEKSPPLYAIKTKVPENFPILVKFTQENSMLGNTDMKEIDLTCRRPNQQNRFALSKAGTSNKSELFKPTLETRTITINKVLIDD